MATNTTNANPISASNHTMNPLPIKPAQTAHPKSKLAFGMGIAIIATVATLVGCSTPSTKPPQSSNPGPAAIVSNPANTTNPSPALGPWKAAHITSLPGWQQAPHSQWVRGFAQQCIEPNKTTPSNSTNSNGNSNTTKSSDQAGNPHVLLNTCLLARQVPNTQAAAKAWLEKTFDAWQLQHEDGQTTGLLTGYYEPVLKGARKRGGPYQTPLYATPSDLITVDLASLYPDLQGKRVRGKLQGNTLVPFDDRAQMTKNPRNTATPLVWVDNKMDAFFLEIQGSGRILLNTGETMRLSYANQNGHPYKAIGKTLVERGELTATQATAQGIQQWAKANFSKVDDLLHTNPSVVFFKENKTLRPEQGPVGAMGLPLSPKLSLAVDRTLVPYGSLLWLDSTHPKSQQPLQQGILAQDTGGAIRGRVRADYFWGTGPEAGDMAGITRQPLRLWLLWPKGVELPSNLN